MLVRTLRSRARLTLQAVALAAYALVAVGGYGLHGLVEHDHASSCCETHAGCLSCGDEYSNRGPAFTQSSDDCSICSFLAQAQSSHVADVAPSGCEPLADASLAVDILVHTLDPDAPLARGPPRA